VFTWSNNMELLQNDRTVTFDGQIAERKAPEAAGPLGKVTMRHRSGNMIKKPESEKSKIREMTLPEGRVTDLDSNLLKAEFLQEGKVAAVAARPGAAAAAKAESPASAPASVGPLANMRLTLDVFDALGDVTLTDGAFKASGGRLHYQRAKDMAVLLGAEKDGVKYDALVYNPDRSQGPVGWSKGSAFSITWNSKERTITFRTANIRGAGRTPAK
jgi:hypothetical protein